MQDPVQQTLSPSGNTANTQHITAGYRMENTGGFFRRNIWGQLLL